MQITDVIDSHVHSNFSADSQMPLDLGCVHAMQQGLGGLVFTDHLDIDHPSKKFNFSVDFEKRAQAIELYKKTIPANFKLLQGVEIGFQSHIVEQMWPAIASYNLDFVLCSVHVLDQRDFWDQSYYIGKTKQQAFERYLQAIYDSVISFEHFDVIAHIGYMCRYVPYDDKTLHYHDHADILDAIFTSLIERGKGIEVNTSGLYYRIDPTIPNMQLLQRYKELGGEIITIGSDSHDHTHIGRNFDGALELLRTLGFSYITYFEKRKPIFIAL